MMPMVVNLSWYDISVWYGNDKINLMARRCTRSTVKMLFTVWGAHT
jgi:hypothetical protein